VRAKAAPPLAAPRQNAKRRNSLGNARILTDQGQ
jgi:hypothetical protein